MDALLDAPVVFVDPFNGAITTMPIAMIGAYVPYGDGLKLEEAARVAAIRDIDEETNLLLSIAANESAELFGTLLQFPEGTGFDALAIELPSLR